MLTQYVFDYSLRRCCNESRGSTFCSIVFDSNESAVKYGAVRTEWRENQKNWDDNFKIHCLMSHNLHGQTYDYLCPLWMSHNLHGKMSYIGIYIMVEGGSPENLCVTKTHHEFVLTKSVFGLEIFFLKNRLWTDFLNVEKIGQYELTFWTWTIEVLNWFFELLNFEKIDWLLVLGKIKVLNQLFELAKNDFLD